MGICVCCAFRLVKHALAPINQTENSVTLSIPSTDDLPSRAFMNTFVSHGDFTGGSKGECFLEGTV